MAAGDGKSPALWAVMKCLAAADADNTGNAGRVYGDASGIKTTSISTSASGALATAVTAA